MTLHLVMATLALGQPVALTPTALDPGHEKGEQDDRPRQTDAESAGPVRDEPPDATSANAPQVRVLLLSTGSMAGDENLSRRVRRTGAELSSFDFESLVVSLAEETGDVALPASRLRTLSRETDASAIIVFAPDRARAELWLDLGDDNGLIRIALVLADGVGETNDAVLAIRLVELLQASLLEPVSEPSLGTSVAPPGPRKPVATIEPKAPRWAVRGGVHGVASVRSVGLMVAPTVGGMVSLGLKRRITVDLELLATALRGRISDPAGTATIGVAASRALVQWWPIPAARVSPAIGGGVGPMLAWTRGSAVSPFTGQTDVTIVALPTAAVDLAIRITPRLRVRAGVRLGVALPALRIRAPQRTTVAGRPLLDGGVTLELTPRSSLR